MCGIAGFVQLKGASLSDAADAQVLRRMAGQIAHRGPDDEQIHLWQNVGLAFRRLSIVDLAGGRQPIFNEDRSVAAICNGEIFNHMDLKAVHCADQKFQSRSDCEIIVQLYDRMGMRCLDELNGIFAGAILDKKRSKLFLFRDRVGVKPVYYFRDDSALVFGSEVKAVLSHPEVPKLFDWTAALTYRNRMYFPHQSDRLTSFFQDIIYLPAGCFLEIDLATGEVAERAYWRPNGAGETIADRREAVDRYRELLGDSVRLQLMGDVECGVFLSGGIDSLAVACFAARHLKPNTFTVLSQSTVTNGDAPSAHAAAEALGLPNHMVLFDWRRLDVPPGLWRTILWKVETPVAGAEQFYKYLLHAYARTRIPGLKVMLLGSGSDEFNGGYTKSFFNLPDDPTWDAFGRVMRRYEREALLLRGRSWNSYAQATAGGRPVIRQEFLAGLADARAYEHPWHACRDLYRRTLQTYHLWHEDRTAAANGIEARVPFLDHRLVELTHSISPALYQDLFWDKTILRDAMTGLLPEAFRQRPKGPFFFGEDIRYTRRLLYNMLAAERHVLLEEACAELAGIAGVVEADVFWELFRGIPEDPEFARVDLMLDLVNMGLLASMARSPPEPKGWDGPLPVEPVEIAGSMQWDELFGSSLMRRESSLGMNSVLRYADGIRLLRKEGGDPKVEDEGDYYILRNSELEFVLETELEPWVIFLRHVDGRRTVAENLRDSGLRVQDIWKHLEEAVEYEVLAIVR